MLAVAVLLLASAVRAADDAPSPPGSAAVPPRALVMPNPPPPAGLARAQVRLGVWIDERGTVTEAEVLGGTREWREAAVAAVKQWRFEPVCWQGQPLPVRTEVEFALSGRDVRSSVSPVPNLPGERHAEKEFGLQPPVLQSDPEIVQPLAARRRGNTDLVLLGYTVEADGRPAHFAVQGEAPEWLVRAALDYVSERKYAPATIRGRPVAVAYRQGVSFNGLPVEDPGLEQVRRVGDPVYPYARLLAGEEGVAQVKFGIDGTGAVAWTEVVGATQPDFGEALRAAVETWTFDPELPAESRERQFTYDFLLRRVPYVARRLAERIQAGETFSGPVGLDAKVKGVARPELVYPRSLLGTCTPGVVRVEFTIDRTGLALLPRVVEGVNPALDWAALTCANGIRFLPPTRGGRPVEVRVTMLVKFTPPAPAAAPPPAG